MQPTHNRLLRKNDELCTWTLVDEGEGWLRPQLASAHDLDFGLSTSCYGLFKNTREATEVLRALAAEYNLCDVLLGLQKASPGKPCFGHQLKRCKGACIGKEPLAKHTLRLVGALVRLKLVSWPLAGPALIREGEEAHLIDGWRYLGTVTHDDEAAELLASERPPFDRDIYKLLAKYAGKLQALAPAPERTTE